MESFIGRVIQLNCIQTKKFCLRDRLDDAGLSASVREYGLIQPLAVAVSGKKIDLISGHKRLFLLKKAKRKTVPVFLINEKTPQKLFLATLLLNHPQSYSDLDRCRVIQKATSDFSFSAEATRTAVLPLIGLPPSPKILNQYQQVAKLPENILKRIRQQEIPFQGSFGLSHFKKPDLDFLAKRVLVKIRPTASQLAHICEWLLDLIQTQRQSVVDILKKMPVTISKSNDFRAATDLFYKNLRCLRFPELVAKEKAFNVVAQSLSGGLPGLEIRAPDHFEQEGFSIHAQLKNSKHLSEVIQRLQQVQNEASTLFDTLL